MTDLNSSFAGDLVRLRRLREMDPTFAEICRDYETLLDEIRDLDANSDHKRRHLRDLNDSLSGLRVELKKMLRCAMALKNG